MLPLQISCISVTAILSIHCFLGLLLFFFSIFAFLHLWHNLDFICFCFGFTLCSFKMSTTTLHRMSTAFILPVSSFHAVERLSGYTTLLHELTLRASPHKMHLLPSFLSVRCLLGASLLLLILLFPQENCRVPPTEHQTKHPSISARVWHSISIRKMELRAILKCQLGCLLHHKRRTVHQEETTAPP